ncbi:MAG: Asp23/Gls24 family envelope stress response protein [Erysipelotrichales bacterium]|nr:Asp23/Gls24 family envelope stress response protein [Erysipelotrichales bacterium]
MTQEYFAINTNSSSGVFGLTKGVFETIAAIAITESEYAELGDASRFHHSVSCKLTKDKMTISAEVKIKYGANVNDACVDLQKRIYSAIYNMSEIKVDFIDIQVIGFTFD